MVIRFLSLNEEVKNMNRKNQASLKDMRMVVLGLMLLIIFMAGPSLAMDAYLRVDTFTKTMPDGTSITMWGYALCDNTFTNCGPATAPGPGLTATAGDTVNIHIRNNLTGLHTEPTSVIVQGQTPSLTPGTYPVWTDGLVGARTNTSQRVRSFTTETPVGGTSVYTWTNVRAGTYLYQSGTHPGAQVQMGLYGALVVNPTILGRAYSDASTAYDSQMTILFSEIDPELHYSIASGLYGTPPPPPPATPTRGQMTSPADYHPKYFLINREPYSPGRAPIPAGNPGQRLLIRFLNAGLVEKTPTLQNHMTVIAEDGNVFPYSKNQYSVLLPAGKTMDAILITPPTAGYLPLFDRSLNLTNEAASPGGDLIYLEVGATQYTLSIIKDGTGTGTVSAQSLPGGINCGTICSHAYLAGTEIRLIAEPDFNSVFTAWSGGGCSGFADCTMIFNADVSVTATFTNISGARTGFLTLKKPNSGKVKTSKPYKIKWKFKVDPGPTIRIDLFQNNQFIANIASAAPAGTPNQKGKGKETYLWTVPPTIPYGAGYQIRIMSNTNPAYADISNKTFNIVP
jgi:hypothetical protein